MGGEEVMTWDDVRAGVASLLEVLKAMEARGEIVLSPFLKEERPGRITEAGIEYLRMYHIPAAVDFHPEGILLDRIELLHFYANRLEVYDIDDRAWIAASRRF
jgi:hypothetical protein